MGESLKQQTKKGLYWKFAEQFSNYGIKFIIGIVMARMLSPSDYGITALPGVFMAITYIFANGSFGQALIRKTDLKEEDLSTAFYYSMVVGIFFYTLLFFASPWIADFYDTPVLKPLMRVTALGFVYGPIASIQHTLLLRDMKFKTLAKTSVSCKIIGGVVGIVMAYIGLGVWALVISDMAGVLTAQIINICIVKWYPKTGWSKESFKYLWGYGNKMIMSQLIDTLYTNITPIFIGKYYSTYQLGVYNRAQQYAALPSRNITGTLQGVTFPALSKIQDDKERLARNYRKMLRVSAFIVFPMMMMLSALARPFIITLISTKWESSIILLQIICFSMMWYPIHAINLNLLLVKGRSDLFLRVEIVKKIVGLSILIFTLPQGLIVLCYGRIVSSLLALFINTYYTSKLINYSFLKQIKDMTPSLLLSFCIWGVILGINLFIESYWAQIFVGGLVGAGVYLGTAYIFHMPELKEVKYLLSRKQS
jgi:O-antigen/teichoic acid export membrane protein